MFMSKTTCLSRFRFSPTERFPHNPLLLWTPAASCWRFRCSSAGPLLQLRVAVQQRAGVGVAALFGSLGCAAPLSHACSGGRNQTAAFECRGSRELFLRCRLKQPKSPRCLWLIRTETRREQLTHLFQHSLSQRSILITWYQGAALMVSRECRSNKNQNKENILNVYFFWGSFCIKQR